MTLRTLPAPLKGYRIGDPNGIYPIWSASGAKAVQGRWHAFGDSVIYASEHYSTAVLEKLVHYNGTMPPNQHYIEIAVPAGASYEVFNPALVPDWHSAAGDTARMFGHAWFQEQRSALLIVPSVVARPENNLVINTTHPDFGRITPGLEIPIYWDSRLFS